MQPILSQVCTLHAPFDEDLREFAAAHCAGAEVWLTKLENYLERHSLAQTRELVQASALQLPVASYQGGLLDSQGERRREAWELFQRRLKLCHDLGIGAMVVACDVAGPVSSQLVERVQFSLADAARLAESHDIRLALEFQSGSAVGNNLQTAAALVDQVNSRWLGLCLDLFHFWVGPSKFEDLSLVSDENLVHVQLCDLSAAPREWASDADRILPGDGDLPVAGVIDHLRAVGYQGPVSVETMNPQFWQVPALQFAEIAITALRGVLGISDRETAGGKEF